jgi:hypothetical protein
VVELGSGGYHAARRKSRSGGRLCVISPSSQLRDAGPILDSPPGCHFGVLALPRGTLKIDERPDPPLSIQRAGAWSANAVGAGAT